MVNNRLLEKAELYKEDLDYDEYIEHSWDEFLMEEAEKFAMKSKYSVDYKAKFMRDVEKINLEFKSPKSLSGDIAEKFYIFVNAWEVPSNLRTFVEDLPDFDYKTEDEFLDDATSEFIDGYIDYIYEIDKEFDMI